ncbi:hypothetical protein NQ176_g9807 [Zarea fungicola]|uniref:Uncharacterized protein n=1 Tax=Zarea fungicola TaxID=93591 RepID=A0ACC1MJF9_9HYPO|nr:hypothetical protein NQ176_g9807 [Lecanicillium fungicola]
MIVSGVGSYGIELAENHIKAGKAITSASTAKVAQISEFLGGGTVDQSVPPIAPSVVHYYLLKCVSPVIDHTKDDPAKVIRNGSVDFLLSTIAQASQLLPLMRPETSIIVSISGIPSGKQTNNVMVKEHGQRRREAGQRWLAWCSTGFLSTIAGAPREPEPTTGTCSPTQTAMI